MPDGVYWFSGALAFLGLINVIWGGLCALAQTALKNLVAYSSVNHMGYAFQVDGYKEAQKMLMMGIR